MKCKILAILILSLSIFGQIDACAELSEQYVDFPGLSLWLDAGYGITTNAAGDVTRWEDRYTPNNHFNNFAWSPNDAQSPEFVASCINGRPALRFVWDGVNAGKELRIDYESEIWMKKSDMTAFIVFRSNSPSNFNKRETLFSQKQDRPEYTQAGYAVYINLNDGKVRPAISNGVSTETPAGLVNVRDGQPKIVEVQWDRDSMMLQYLNGTLDAWRNISAMKDDSLATGYYLYIGSNRWSPYYFTGDIAEIIIYKRLLSATERDSVMSYLNYKYISTQPPQNCGDLGTEYNQMDFNRDCYVDIYDAMEFMYRWLECTDPSSEQCDTVY